MKSKYLILIFFIVGTVIISSCTLTNIPEQEIPLEEPVDEQVTDLVEADEVTDGIVSEEIIEEDEKTIIETLEPVVFTHHITDLSKIVKITPSGSARSYISPRNMEERTPVYAPIDSEFGAIGYYTENVNNKNYPIYLLYFKVNDNVVYAFDHIGEVSDRIKAASPQEPRFQDSRTSEPSSRISIKGGELIGYVGINPSSRIWDFFVIDHTNRNKVANPKRHYTEGGPTFYLTGLCPYSFYPEDMKKEYLALFGYWERDEIIYYSDPECGDISRDVIGTASGYWYLDSGTDKIYNEPLIIVSSLDGSVGWTGVGEPVGFFEDRGGFDNSYVAEFIIVPEELTIGQSECYVDENEASKESIFVKVLSDTELAVFYSEGKCPNSFPEEGYKVYVR